MKGCKIDFIKKTLTITKEFEDKMQDMESEEYRYYNRVITEIPRIRINEERTLLSPIIKKDK